MALEVQQHIPLREHTTFRLGGTARFFVSVTSVEELREALKYAREQELPVYLLGGGSNVLFSDKGWDGLVIHIALTGTEYTEDSKGDAQVIAAAGVEWDTLVAETVSQGLWGMENLSAIPGTVGAAPIQNIGAYGIEVQEIIDWVEVLDRRDHELHILSVGECLFGYRDSVFKHEEGVAYIVTRVAFRLSTHPNLRLSYRDLSERFCDRSDVTVQEVRDAVVEIRSQKFPSLTDVGTAGSFFKNPIIPKEKYESLKETFGVVPQYPVDDARVKIPLGWILEQLGWKGRRLGNVGCWDAQALVVVQYGEATTNELLQFVKDMIGDVQQQTGITIEPEVRIVHNH